MKLYKLHVRGFSMDVSGNKKHKGTFEAVSDRINYIKKMCIRDSRISDSQYAQMQQLEDEIPRAIKRLEKNEMFKI